MFYRIFKENLLWEFKQELTNSNNVERLITSYSKINAATCQQSANPFLSSPMNDVLKTHIINYSKTKDVYVAYRKSGYRKKFFEAHREEITLHKAAKQAFSKQEGKIPRVKELNEEYAEVIAEKKKAYAEYREVKKDMQDYLTAKHNIDTFLDLNRSEEQDQKKQKEKENNR